MYDLIKLCEKYEQDRGARAVTRAQIEAVVRDAMINVQLIEAPPYLAVLSYFAAWMTLNGNWHSGEAP